MLEWKGIEIEPSEPSKARPSLLSRPSARDIQPIATRRYVENFKRISGAATSHSARLSKWHAAAWAEHAGRGGTSPCRSLPRAKPPIPRCDFSVGRLFRCVAEALRERLATSRTWRLRAARTCAGHSSAVCFNFDGVSLGRPRCEPAFRGPTAHELSRH